MRGVLKWHLPTYPFVKLTEHGFVVCRVDNFQPDVEALIYVTGIVIISCHAWKGYGQIQCGLVQSVLKLMHKCKDTFIIAYFGGNSGCSIVRVQTDRYWYKSFLYDLPIY